MMKLVMEAVMIIVIICGLVFITRVTASENQIDSTPPPRENENDDT